MGFSRPVLVLLDRSVDLSVMLHHPWTYQALATDMLQVRLNHITVENEDNGQSKKKTFDVDNTDAFWASNAGRIFPEAIAEVDTFTKEYKTDMENMNNRTGGDEATEALTAAIGLIPEMQERKRRLDLHTDVATKLLKIIKEREIHTFHKLEREILKRNTVDKKEIKTCLMEPGHGS